MADDKKLDYIQDRIDTVIDRVADVKQDIVSLKASFEHHVEQDETMRSEISHMNNVWHENTLSLREHMRRTDLLEEYVKNVDARFSPLEMDLFRKKAIRNWISTKLKFIAKVGAAVSALGATGLALKHVVDLLLSN